ncbi:MAG TPA: NYN domain-containing protein [Rhodospirillaceae bacterium]|nr:NYN domain-containing protein [Rhodospirillaceae bacterium]MAX63878.1 NYN domain-containing protein [Rhodospirillaceae bacterium]MBB57312.1 NYN domain-containing protein [Rhodospirillaceae bacterium]HAE02977.1 NYN domain-containing protein [Rhodospirillaceae bacterium]HAJ19031.1 NYN domain-containing protein [Rhodospirillaceae bacterium]|tara:strand:+ start:61 stop:684 length:624 start_codon:yes stop_codon:yes gene_type:complete
MRTIVYIDGFNLYYGALKGTPNKWLDVSTLCRSILKPHNDIIKIKYFTARVSARPNDPSQPQRQDIYFRALQSYCPEVEFYFGHFLSHAVSAPLENPTPAAKFVKVIKTEEKGSDVNLAVHLVNDCWLDAYDCAVVISNDSDIAEAMRLVKLHSSKAIGLVTPGNRHPSQQLKTHADFSLRLRPHILKASQLPSQIPGTNITKPMQW